MAMERNQEILSRALTEVIIELCEGVVYDTFFGGEGVEWSDAAVSRL